MSLWSLHLRHRYHVAQPAQAPGQACLLAQRRLRQVGTVVGLCFGEVEGCRVFS